MPRRDHPPPPYAKLPANMPGSETPPRPSNHLPHRPDPHSPADPSDYFDAAVDHFVSHHLAAGLWVAARIVYHSAAALAGLAIAKWYFDATWPLSERGFEYLLLVAIGAVPVVLAVPFYGFVVSYVIRRGVAVCARGARATGLDAPVLIAVAVALVGAAAWHLAPPDLTPHNLFQPAVDPQALRYELHTDLHHEVQLHLADLRRELVVQANCHSQKITDLEASVKRLQHDFEVFQNRSVATSLQQAVDACGVAKVAELAAAALTWVRMV